MEKKENNYAFIDSQNVHKGIKSLGWEMDMDNLLPKIEREVKQKRTV